MKRATIASLAVPGGFHDGDWVESKDQDPEGDIRLLQLADVGDGLFRDRSDRWVNEETFHRLQCSWVRPGDVLIARMPDPLGRACLVLAGLGRTITVVDVAVLRCDPNRADPRYVTYAINSLETRSLVECQQDGATRQRVPRKRLGRIQVPAPALTEQRAIADYLDRETAKIDTLIEEQQRLIEMLRERRKAVLDEVTSTAVGDVLRLKFLFTPSSEAKHPNEEVLSVYRDYGVIPKASRNDNFNRTPENLDRYLFVRPGDLVVNRMKAWQGSLGVSNYRGIVSADYEVLRPSSDRLHSRFAHLFLRSPKLVAEYAVRSTGIRPSQWRLYWDEMGNVEIPIPPHRSQEQIVKQIDEQTTKIDELIAETERFIELSRERRAALITAAVTGQIDVRDRVREGAA